MFNNTVEKGQKLANCRWEEKTLEEKTREVAQEIRNELLKTPATFSSWPPSEAEVLLKVTNIPTLKQRVYCKVSFQKGQKIFEGKASGFIDWARPHLSRQQWSKEDIKTHNFSIFSKKKNGFEGGNQLDKKVWPWDIV